MSSDAGKGPQDRRRLLVEQQQSGRGAIRVQDWAVVEEPLEVQINGRSFAVTMRTPGHDAELAVGLLFSEGILRAPQEVVAVEVSDEPPPTAPSADQEGASVSLPRGLAGRRISVQLSDEAFDRWARRRIEREIVASSACGVCGKPSLEDLWHELVPLQRLEWDREARAELIQRMQASQALFRDTGGAHAAALFSAKGDLIALYEDVGRHNAVDKLIGSRLLAGAGDLAGSILATSGRAGFEIVQKAITARVPVLIAVGAASTLAAELAREAGLELHSFVGPRRGNRLLP